MVTERTVDGINAGRHLLVALALAAAGAWAYSTSFAGVFVFDDGPAIADNPNIKSLLPLAESMSAPPEVTVSGRPIAALTLAINYALAPADARDVMAAEGAAAPPDAASRFYRNVWGYHFVNLAVHLAAALVLFDVVRRSLLTGKLRARFGRSATALAFASALLWVVHPLQTESVTYIVQRVEALMGLFYLLTLYCAIRAADHDAWTVAAIISCALGMGSKEVMVTAPIMVWLWDEVFRGSHRRRGTLYAGLAATWVILAVLVRSETRPQSVGFALGWTAWSYLRTQAGVVVHYLRLAIVPSPLVFDYGWPQARSFAEVAPQALLLLTLIVLTSIALRRRHPLGFLGAWFFIILAPTSSILPITTEVASEHRMYLPVAAVIVLAVAGACEIGRRLLERTALNESSRRRVGLVAGVVAIAAVAGCFAEITRARGRDYWSEERLWVDTVQKRPQNERARVGYGIDLLSRQRFAEAEAQLRVAVSLDDRNAHAHMNLGSALSAQDKLDEGIAHLERALALDPERKETYGLLGEAYSSKGKSELAVKYFLRAVELMPDNPFLLRRVAAELALSRNDAVRDVAKAVVLAERAVRLTNSQDFIALDTLAAAYAEQRRFAAAVASERNAIAVAQAQHNDAARSQLTQRLRLYQSGRSVRDAR